MSNPSWKKIIIKPNALQHTAYADWYRYGTSDPAGVPMVVYVGGAIPKNTYSERQATRPDIIAVEFENARELNPMACVDLLIIPCPLSIMERRSVWRSEFREHFTRELLPAIENREPLRMSVVGYSLGSYFAMCLLAERATACGLATVGGAGMPEALLESDPPDLHKKRIISFCNENDHLFEITEKFRNTLLSRGIHLETTRRAGGHPFRNYAENGSVRDAFAFALQCLQKRGTWIA